MASSPQQQLEREDLAASVKRYLRGPHLGQLALRQRWQREVARRVLRATRSAWSSHGARTVADLCIKKYVIHASGSIFAPVPKVGTRSIERIFATLLRERPDIEARLDPLPTVRTGELAGYRIFSIVRNPWSRVLSVYQDKVGQSHKLGNLAILSRYRGLTPGMTFADFVGWLGSDEGSDQRADRHWLSQHIILSHPPDDRSSSGFVGRFENFEADLGEIMWQMGLPVSEVPKRNVTSHAAGKTSYRDFYSARSRAIIRERYARDIELFGYEF